MGLRPEPQGKKDRGHGGLLYQKVLYSRLCDGTVPRCAAGGGNSFTARPTGQKGTILECNSNSYSTI